MLWKNQVTEKHSNKFKRILFVTNTVITVFPNCTDQLVSSVRTCEFGAMTESNISDADRKKKLLLYSLTGYVKNLPKRS